MSDGRSVSIVAVDGGYIIEHNDLVKVQLDTGTKGADGKPVMVSQFKAGKRNVAVRATVEDVMKLMGQLLIKRMEIKQEENAVHDMISAAYLNKQVSMAEKSTGPYPTEAGYTGQ